MARTKEEVDIQPESNILTVFSRLPYRPWYAVAEFVDNSIQSYFDNKSRLKATDGKKSGLKIQIEYSQRDGGTLTIRDNAGGIAPSQFKRAFKSADIPADTSGLHEFGMGMKCAACWFSPRWQVRTSALGDSFLRTIDFDLKEIDRKRPKRLSVEVASAAKDLHFTELVLRDLHHPLHGRTVGKIKEHLASIYRHFISKGDIQIDFEGPIAYAEPAILRAPFHKTPNGKARSWKQLIDIKLSKGKSVTGFVAIRETASTSEAGFALFRKSRLIQGSVDETWRPEELFGKSNSFLYQRLFGELHFQGFRVSHTKDALVIDDVEEVLVQRLKSSMSRGAESIITQAREHRVGASSEEVAPRAKRVLQKLEKTFDREMSRVIRSQASSSPNTSRPPERLTKPKKGTKSDDDIQSTFAIKFRNEEWKVTVLLSFEEGLLSLIEVSDYKGVKEVPRSLTVRLSAKDPFFQRYVGSDPASLETFMRMAVGLVVAETTARDAGVSKAGIVRENLNEILKKAMGR